MSYAPHIAVTPTLVIETESARDRHVDNPDGSWTMVPTPPPGGCWVIVDDRNEKRTTWRRLRLVWTAEARDGR